MKAPSFPEPALGLVTLGGIEVSEGAVIHNYGDLVINGGHWSVANLSVYNNDTLWTPVSIDGNTSHYTVASNGAFKIVDASGKVLLSWSVEYEQAFTLEGIYKLHPVDSHHKGDRLTDGTYYQVDNFAYGTTLEVFVLSTDNQIISADASATNNATITYIPPSSNYNGLARILVINTSQSSPSQPIRVFVDDVLVVYIANNS